MSRRQLQSSIARDNDNIVSRSKYQKAKEAARIWHEKYMTAKQENEELLKKIDYVYFMKKMDLDKKIKVCLFISKNLLFRCYK